MTLPPRKTRLRRRSAARAADGPPFSTLARGKPIKKRNDKRRAKEFARVYGSAERVEWFKGRLCAVRRCYEHLPAHHEGPTECAHAKGGGAGRKGGAATILPLCQGHHRTLHNVGVKTFERVYGIDLLKTAAEYERDWQAHLARSSERPET